jgi:ABC-2 type transport system permease protein
VLWYKAWLETRVRFLLCLIALPVFGAYMVHSDFRNADYQTPALFYYAVIHGAFGMIGGLWLVAVIFLTMGGLLREQAAGAATFTLALPFSRMRLMAVRIAVCLMQAITLLVVPCIAIYIEDRILGRPYPVSQALFHVVLMVSGGMVFLAVSLLISSLVAGEYSAPIVALCALIGIAATMNDPPAQMLSPFHFMGGADYFDRATELFAGPVPWLNAGIWILVAAVLLAASVRATQIREF